MHSVEQSVSLSSALRGNSLSLNTLGGRRWKGVKGVQGAETLSRPIPTVTVNFEEIVFSDRSEHHLAPLCRSAVVYKCELLTYLLDSAIASYTALQSACAKKTLINQTKVYFHATKLKSRELLCHQRHFMVDDSQRSATNVRFNARFGR